MSNRDLYPDDIMHLWWCRCCPQPKRWQVRTTQEWIDHVAEHIKSYEPMAEEPL